AADFTAVIAWGDGTTSPGTVRRDPAGGFSVLGDHTYAVSGAFPVRVTINEVGVGAVATTAATATVAVRVIPLTGGLDPLSDSGSSNADGVTNVTQPRFLGTAAPGAVITLLAQGSGQAAPTPIGQTTTNASG